MWLKFAAARSNFHVMHRVRRALPVALIVFAASTAHAYTVKTTSTGAPVHWATGDVTLTLAFTPAPAGVDVVRATAAANDGLATWQAALDGTGVTLMTEPGTAGTDHTDGVDSVRWALTADDPNIEKGVLALTFVAYQSGSGEITDADIVMNGVDFAWATDPTACTTRYDVASALTHEFGHALGLAHALGHPEATMFATAEPCEISKRDLAADDVDGIDELYRPTTPPPQPGTCAAGSAKGTASTALVVLAIVILRRRRARAAVVATAMTAVVLAGAPADAATLRQLTLVDLADSADLVIRGRVVATAVSDDGQLATDSAILVDECVAGSCPIALTVRRRGGERDGRGLWVDGEATLAPGTEVVLYLRADTRGHLRVLGGVQGALRIVRVQGVPYAVRDLRGHQVLVGDAWQAGDVEVLDLAAVRQSVARAIAPAAR
ncbi:MAG: matrixin family metalloprotease [Deltaproteobacteria bacterium]|nr:matrixin family metalloprotease [Deltaproteobacteria bacterium]